MTNTAEASPAATNRRTRFLVRVLWFLLLPTCIGWTLNQAGGFLNRSGKRAGTIGAALTEKGVKVANAGGMKDWTEAGLPVRRLESKK